MPAQEQWIDADVRRTDRLSVTAQRHRFTRTALLLVLLLALGAVGWFAASRPSASGSPPPPWPARPAQTGSATCTDPSTNQQWRVSWQVSSQMGVLPTGLDKRTLPDGPWQTQSGERWQMRWNQAPAQIAGTDFAWDNTLTAPLSGLSQVAVSASLSPRFVTPDGACTVYTAPFGPGAPGTGSVAVVGDSLIAQLVPGGKTESVTTGATASPVPGTSLSPSSAAATEAPATDGPLIEALRGQGLRVQIDGQGGRRWVVAQEQTDALELANGTMVDELRGLREAGKVVVALGTNDAGWSALGSEALYEERLSYSLTQLENTLGELSRSGHCTVLLTVAGTGKTNSDIPRSERFELAAARINDLMRRAAEASPRLALYDWGSQGDQHAYGTADSWFGPDTVHLSPAGIRAYTQALTEAAQLPCS